MKRTKLIGYSSPSRRQRGASDAGMIVWLIGITALISGTMTFMGWVRSVKDARHGIKEIPVEEYEAQQAAASFMDE
jgi:hypothetical protein